MGFLKKSATLKSRAFILLIALLVPLSILKPTILQPLQLRWSLIFTSPKLFLVYVHKAQQIISHQHVLSHLWLKIVINALWKPHRLLVSCCAVPPAGIGVVEISYEDHVLQMWRFFYLSWESFICFFLTRQSVAGTCNTARVCLLATHQLRTLRCPVICY